MKIYDCFTFFNEYEILKIRFEELYDIVDYFVVVECDQTFTGKNKPFYFDQVDLNEWGIHDKVIRIKGSFPAQDMGAWDREIYQRNLVSQGIAEADASDIIIISDVDEIPSRKTILNIKSLQMPIQLDVTQFFWDYHWVVPDHCNQGARPVVCNVEQLSLADAQTLRAAQMDRVPNAGWHFSFFDTEERVKTKIESFAHTEYDLDEYKSLDRVLYRIENGIDPFDRFPLKYTEIDDTYPQYLKKDLSY